MTGTEKQIAWAEDIQKTIIKAIAETMNDAKNSPRYDAKDARQAAVLTMWAEIAEAVENVQYAGNLITVYGLVKTNMTTQKVIMTIMAARKNAHLAENAEQKKLLHV